MKLVLSVAALGLSAGVATAVATQSSCTTTTNVAPAATACSAAVGCGKGQLQTIAAVASGQDPVASRQAVLEALAEGSGSVAPEAPMPPEAPVAPAPPQAPRAGLRRTFKFEGGQLKALEGSRPGAGDENSGTDSSAPCEDEHVCTEPGCCGDDPKQAGSKAPKAKSAKGAKEGKKAKTKAKAKAKGEADVTLGLGYDGGVSDTVRREIEAAQRQVERAMRDAERVQEQQLAQAKRQIEQATGQAARMQEQSLAQAKRQIEQALRQTEHARQRAVAEHGEHGSAREAELNRARAEIERAVADGRRAHEEALAESRHAIDEARVQARHAQADSLPFRARIAQLFHGDREDDGKSERERALEARVAELEQRLAEVGHDQTPTPPAPSSLPRTQPGGRRGVRGFLFSAPTLAPHGDPDCTPDRARVVIPGVVGPMQGQAGQGQAGAWRWRLEELPGGNGFSVRTWSGEDDDDGDDRDCNPTRAQIFQFEGDAPAATWTDEDEAQWEELDEAEEWGDDVAEFEEELEGELEDIDEAFEEAFEDVQDELEEVEESEAADESDPTVVRVAPYAAWPWATPTVQQRPWYPLAQLTTTDAVPAARIELRDVLSQMRSEVEQLRATLRDLRTEVEARKNDGLR